MAGVERPPLAVKVSLEPGAEVHVRGDRNPDIPEVASNVPRRDIKTAAEGNRQVLEVATDPQAFGVNVERGLGRTRILVAEGDLAVNPFDDRVHPAPSVRQMSEKLGGDRR